MRLFELELDLPAKAGPQNILTTVDRALEPRIPNGAVPIRFVITDSTDKHYHCEIGVLSDLNASRYASPDSIFRFNRRKFEDQQRFTAVLLVPTGIGAAIGGHAGDAGPTARLIGAACDRLITHPNVVNAADINEMPENTLYVEGSVIARLMMGTVGIAPVRANRLLVILQRHEEDIIWHNAVNAVNAARASAGFSCERIEPLPSPLRMTTRYASSGRATGEVEGFDSLCALIEKHRDEFDAVAISTVVDVDRELHDDYFFDRGDPVNPWGGIEAILTHGISSLFDIPSAHSPMYEDAELMNSDPDIMEPRKAAEGVSVAFLHCILRGLSRSPRMVTDPSAFPYPGVVAAADISCLIVPDGCLGLPTLAALEQGIPVIAVRENRNRMQNDLSLLPWKPGQFHRVENYLEAAGVLTALRAGVPPSAVRRPIASAELGPQPQRSAVGTYPKAIEV